MVHELRFMVNSFGELLELSLTTHLSPLKVELVKHAGLIYITIIEQ